MPLQISNTLSAYLQWEARSLSEARELCEENFPLVHSVDALDRRDKFHLRNSFIYLNDITLMCVNTTGHRIKLHDDDRVGALIPLANQIAVNDESIAPGELLIPTLGPRTTMASKNYNGLVVLLPQRTIDSSQSEFSEFDVGEFEQMKRFDTRHDTAQSLINYLKFLITELDQSSALAQSQALQNSASAMLKDYFTLLMLEQNAEPDSKSKSLLESWQVARAEAYIEAHLSEPLTITEIAAVIGISTRTLQTEFRRCRGIAPHAFIQQLRLDLLHQKLSCAEPPAQVTNIAYECGFTHLGRCAHYYRQRFGETPQETLKRALRD